MRRLLLFVPPPPPPSTSIINEWLALLLRGYFISSVAVAVAREMLSGGIRRVKLIEIQIKTLNFTRP